MTALFNEDYRKHMFTDFFCQGALGAQMAKDMGLEQEYEHVQHAREMQYKAQAKQVNVWFEKMFG